MNKLITLAFITSATSSACDPMRTITVHNKLKEPISVNFKFGGCESKIFSNDHTTSSLDTLSLGTSGDDKWAGVAYSFGLWRKADVDSFRTCLDTIMVTRTKGNETTKYYGKELEGLLPEKRSFFGADIKIKIK